MRVVLLKSGLTHGGGLEKYTLRLASALVARGDEVTVLTTDCNGQDEPFEIISLGQRSKLSWRHLQRFDRWCSEWLAAHPHDAVVGLDRNWCPQHYYRAGNGVHAAYLARRAVTSSWAKRLSFRINPLHRLILDMERTTFESPCLERLVTNSWMVREELLDHYPAVDANKVVVIHNGVEWHELGPAFEATWQGRGEQYYRFLFVGNEYGRKGLPLLLRALALLPHRDWQLAVVGRERNERPYRALAHQLGLEKQVRFCGPQREMIPWYQGADCVVIPSLYDPFANVTVEALAMGCWVVSSRANGGCEVLPSTQCFSDLADPAELAAGLAEALRHPKEEAGARAIREQCRRLDFGQQLATLVATIQVQGPFCCS